MRKHLITLAMVLGALGCQKPTPKAAAPAAQERPVLHVSDKDPEASAGPEEAADGTEDEVLVELNSMDGDDDYSRELKDVDDAEPESFRFNSVEGAHDGVAIATLDPDETMDEALERLRADPRVKVAEPIVEVRASYVPNDPQYQVQWNLKQINMEKAWDKAQGEGVVVAVIDTGIAYEDHGEFKQVPDLKGAKFVPGYDFVNDTEHPNDDNGHGTHVAGTIAQVTNNAEGVAGVAPKATLMPLKVLSAEGYGNSADIADAIHWAADHGAKVINMSLGGGSASKVMADAVAYARKKGVVVVCAAGNAARGVVEYPAAYAGAVAVSAVGKTGALAPYSSWGKEIDIAAPGGDKSQSAEGGILQNTIDPNDPSKSVYAWYQGTSMATPHVAGAAAVIYSAGAKNPDEVEEALFRGAEARGVAWNDRTGHGLLDVDASLTALKAMHGEGAAAEAPVAQADEGSDDRIAALEAERPGTGESLAKVVLGLVMALGTAATLRSRQRNTLGPALLVAMTMAAAGAFFLPAPGPSASALVPGWIGKVIRIIFDMIEIPIPDWGKWIFGPGRASPIFYSALIPIVASIVGYNWKGTRQVMGGLCIGFAAFMTYAAWSAAPGLAWMPFTFLALPWLLTNALVSLFLARALIRKEA